MLCVFYVWSVVLTDDALKIDVRDEDGTTARDQYVAPCDAYVLADTHVES